MENTNKEKIGLASDHAGYEMKECIRIFLNRKSISYIDYGTYSTESVNYAVFGHKLANAIEAGEVSRGIAVCGSGNGINMTMNRHEKIRSALCWNEEIVRLARAHNDANVLTLPGRFLSVDLAEKIVDLFFNTPFEGGRHKERVNTISITVE
jgi:ribose 5-phosphate isomerase B